MHTRSGWDGGEPVHLGQGAQGGRLESLPPPPRVQARVEPPAVLSRS